MSNSVASSSSRLMVKNLPKHLDELSQKKHFSKFGRVTDVRIMFKGNDNRRFGFVGYIKDDDAKSALEKLNNTYIDTSKITIEYAQTLDTLETDQSKKISLRKKNERNEKNQKEMYNEIKTKSSKKNDEIPDTTEDNKKVLKKREMDDFLDMMEIDKTKIKAKKKLNTEEPKSNYHRDENTNTEKVDSLEVDDRRLYVTNIPFLMVKDEVRELFEKFGNVTECILPKNQQGNSKGMAYISYEDSNDAIQAISKLDNKINFGRILHIKQAFKSRRELFTNKDESKIQIANEKSSFKKIKRGQFMDRLDDENSWNTLFLNPNTVMDAVSKSYGISKAEMLDKEVENPAVRIATAETEVINETKEFLKNNGVNIDIFTTERKNCPRSKKVILVKNINTSLKKTKLTGQFSNYGEVSKVLLPKNKAIGIVIFVSTDHAENAFKKLAGYSIDGTVLYLEWAPQDMVEENDDSNNQIAVDSLNTKMQEEVKVDNDDVIEKIEKVETYANFEGDDSQVDKCKTVFVKNLSFNTSEDLFWDFMTEIDMANEVKSLKVVTKNGLSQGFGFIEFHYGTSASKFIKTKQGVILHEHSLKLSISKPNAKPESTRKTVDTNVKVTSKIVIRNLDFAANYREVKELLKNYGDVKAIRMPKKPNGEHRGFCFVEFMSLDDTKEAFEALSHTHFYGRKLAIEYAQE